MTAHSSSIAPVAHARDGGRPLPPAGRRARGDAERGFSLVEVLVVLVILAILMASAILGIRSMRASSTVAIANAGGSAAWDVVQNHRIDNQGILPPVADMTATDGVGFAAGVTDPAGERYARYWPAGVDGPMPVVAGGGTPVQQDAGMANSIAYGRTSDTTGWVGAYDANGNLVFLRGVGGATPVVPAG